MEIEINTELDLVFLKPLGYLHSKSKDSAEKLKTLLDESLCKGIDSSYRPPQKDIELPKPKAEVKAIISTPVTSILSKPLPPEKVKKEAEKRFADKIKVELNDPVEIPKRPRQEKPEARSSPITEQFSKDLPLPDLSSADETSAIAIPLKPLPPLILGKRGLSRSMSSDNVSKVGLPSPSTPTGSGANINIQLSNSNGGGSNAGSSKVSAEQSGVKGPTSQKFQLNARKRLQMVKKKAAQKKLKK